MPKYQYRCKDCGSDLEVQQKFTDDALTECPACDGGQLRKVYNAVGVVFKGSGFYRTDSRADSNGSNGSSGSKSSGSKPDAKPAEASPATSETKSAEPKSPSGSKAPVSA